MSRQEREAWAALLDADPAMRAAMEGFREQIGRDFDLIKRGARPTPHAAKAAARAVYVAAGLDPDQTDDAPDDG